MQGGQTGYPHPLMFLVSVASKGLSHAVSLLFATLARRSISVVSKGLTSYKDCAFLRAFLRAEWAPRDATDAAKDVPRRSGTRLARGIWGTGGDRRKAA